MTVTEAIQLANAGDIKAMESLANYYMNESQDNPSVENRRSALEWYTRAAENGSEYGAKMAANMNLIKCIAARNALGAEVVSSCLDEEMYEIDRMLSFMKKPDPEFIQKVNEEKTVLYALLGIITRDEPESEIHFKKAVATMIPYAKNYISGEAFIMMTASLGFLGREYIWQRNLTAFLVNCLKECDTNLSDHELYDSQIPIAYDTLAFLYLNHGDENAAYETFVKLTKFEEAYNDMLPKFKKKLFGGYKYIG